MEGTVLSRGYPYCPFWRKVTISEFPRMTVHHEKWVESIANGLVGRVYLPWLFPWFSMVVSIVFSIVFPMVFHGCFHCFSIVFPMVFHGFCRYSLKTQKKYISKISENHPTDDPDILRPRISQRFSAPPRSKKNLESQLLRGIEKLLRLI